MNNKTILLRKGLESLVKQSNGIKWEIDGYAYYCGNLPDITNETTLETLKNYKLSDFEDNGTLILSDVTYTKGSKNSLRFVNSKDYNSALLDITNHLFSGDYLPAANNATADTVMGTYSVSFDASAFTLTKMDGATISSPAYLDALIIFGQSFYQVYPDERKIWTSEGVVPLAIVVFTGNDTDTKPFIINDQSKYLNLKINVLLGVNGIDDTSNVSWNVGTDDVLGSMQVVNDAIGTSARVLLTSDDDIAISANDYKLYPNLLKNGVISTTKRLFMSYDFSKNYSNDFGSPARLNIMKTKSDGYRSPQLMLSEATVGENYTTWDGAMQHYHTFASGGMYWLDSCGPSKMGTSLMSDQSTAYNGAIVIGGNTQWAYGNRIAIGGSDNQLGINYSDEAGVLINTTACEIGRGGGTIFGSYESVIQCNEDLATRSGGNYQGTSILLGGERNVINSYDKVASEFIIGGADNILYSTESCGLLACNQNNNSYSYNTIGLGAKECISWNNRQVTFCGLQNEIWNSYRSNIIGQLNYTIKGTNSEFLGYHNYSEHVANSYIGGSYNKSFDTFNSVQVGHGCTIKGRNSSISIGNGIDIRDGDNPVVVFGQYPSRITGDDVSFVIGNGESDNNRLDLLNLTTSGQLKIQKDNNSWYQLTPNGLAFTNTHTNSANKIIVDTMILSTNGAIVYTTFNKTTSEMIRQYSVTIDQILQAISI